MRERLAIWGIFALLMAAFALKGLLLVPPPVDPAAPFNAERAVERLARILGDERPHPVDSPANDLVRDRLIGELRALGLTPEVRERPDCRGMPGSRVVSCSLTRNVVAVLGGEKPGKALLLNAHYDSTPAGPGAADDGIGVATLLEVADNLRRDPPAHPVIFLFNEGEEFGLNGAGAFIDGDPLAPTVGSLINIEARGVEGPAFMFETSIPNGAPLEAFAQSTRRPYANSLAADFAKLIPNYTDVVVFKQRDWKTLSFAIVGNETRYHTPGDNVAALSRRSVQHMGDEVLAATRTLPAASASGQRVYADIAGRLLVSLPLAAAAGLLLLLFAAAGFAAWRERALGRPLLACAAALVAGIAIAFLLSFVAGLIRPGDYWRAYPLLAYLAVYASMIGAMAAALRWLGGRVERRHLAAACWSLVLALGGLLSIFMPGASIFFLLAPALAVSGLFIARARTPLLWAAAIFQAVMLGEVVASLEVLLIDGPLWAVAPFASLIVLPFLVLAVDRPIRPALAAVVLLALGMWVAAFLAPRSNAERPLAFTIDYVRDDETGKAHWAVASKQAPLPPEWSRLGPWKSGTLPYNGRRRWLTEAPMLAIPAAGAEVVGAVTNGNRRRIRLKLAANGANSVALRFADDVPIIAAGLPGRLYAIDKDADSGPTILRCSGRSCEGLELEVELGSTDPVEAKVIATRFALPPQGAQLQKMRPANAHSQYGSDGTIRVTPLTL